MKKIRFDSLAIALSYLDISYKRKLEIIKLYLSDDLQKYLNRNLELFKILDNIDNIKNKLKNKGIGYILLNDKYYPEFLKQIPFPPIIIYYSGNKNLLTKYKNFLAIVGTRKASEFAKEIAFKYAKEISLYDIVIVSGLAYGIDTYAHKGALAGSRLTIAVLGSGIDVVYPKSNKNLYSQIKENGLIISEYPLSSKPLKWHFIARNRIIAALSKGVFIVQAPEKSGALITANYALDYGKDVYCIPAKLGDKQFLGNNKLIQDGAKVILDEKDILQEFGITIQKDKNKKILQDQLDKKILFLIKEGFDTIDKLSLKIKDFSVLSERLIYLELNGFISFDAGGKYSCLI